MGIEVELLDELEGAFGVDAVDAVDAMMDNGPEFARNLPRFDDMDYPYLRLIDPYGDTIFSSYQMHAVVPELERLWVERSSPVVLRVLEMARRAQTGRHLYLRFIGD